MIKGAPEIILDQCILDPKEKQAIYKKLNSWESHGNRVIGSCYKEITDHFDPAELDQYTLSSFEGSMEFNGLVVFKSSLNPNASAIICEIIDSGMHFKVITGDALNTSQFI